MLVFFLFFRYRTPPYMGTQKTRTILAQTGNERAVLHCDVMRKGLKIYILYLYRKKNQYSIGSTFYIHTHTYNLFFMWG